MKIPETVKNNKFYLKTETVDKGNNVEYFKHFFKEGEIDYIIYEYDEFFYHSLTFDVYRGEEPLRINLTKCPIWFKELLKNVFNEAQNPYRVRRIANGERLSVEDILFYNTLAHDEGEDIYDKYTKSNIILIHDKELAEGVKEKIEEERYKVKLMDHGLYCVIRVTEGVVL